jgi:hypothetical protein
MTLSYHCTATVRNRAKEIAELLSDVEKIRTERRRAKANKNKYGGTGSEGSGGGFGGSGSRYGGFGSQETGRYGGPSDRNGAGSGYDGGRRPDYDGGGKLDSLSRLHSLPKLMKCSSDVYRSNDSRAEPEYDEYDAGDDDDRSNKISSSKVPSRSKPSSSSAVTRPTEQPKANKPPVVQDLFDFGDEAEQIQTPAALPRSTAPEPMASTLDDGKDTCCLIHVYSLKNPSPSRRFRRLPGRDNAICPACQAFLQFGSYSRCVLAAQRSTAPKHPTEDVLTCDVSEPLIVKGYGKRYLLHERTVCASAFRWRLR